MPGEITIQDLLRRCTVRIDIGGQQTGTGFFAAPGTIVTCAHVVESVTLSTGAAAPTIEVVDHAGTVHEVDLGGAWDDEATDLAILRLRAPYPHLCALLDGYFRERDHVDSYGYPEKYAGGLPTTLEVEGEMGPPERWLKLKGGQVKVGMSGSAVVNTRTGAVCGVLKRSRDQQTDLGGYAVPLSTLFRVHPGLEGENARFHAKDATWEDLLPADARRLRRELRTARGAEAAAERLFVISIGQTDDGWQVAADVHPGDERIGPVPIDLNIVRRQVARLFRDWASRGRVQQEGGEIGLLGNILFGAAFPSVIGERFVQLREEGARVAVNLRFEDETDSDLIQLPWEHLYYKDANGRGICLAREPGATFARALEREPAPAEPPARRTLRVLVVAVRPQWDDHDETSLGQVEEIVSKLVDIGNRVGTVDVTVMEDDAPDVYRVGDAVPEADIVHYVGFGRFTQEDDQLALGGDGAYGIEWVHLDDLAQSLDVGSQRLVILQLLDAPTDEIPADFSVLASALMQRAPGIPAVIASQYPVIARAANRFNETLYEQLARGTSVDVAVQEARSKLAWGRLSVSPVLLVRRPGELRLAAPGSDVVERRATGAFPNYG